jgi:hypothetical protein
LTIAESVNDGTPDSSTALLADESFAAFALPDSSLSSTNRFGAGLNANFGGISYRDIDGTSYSFDPSLSYAVSERVAARLSFPINYTEFESDEILRAGAVVGFPITLIRSSEHRGWNWEISPFAGTLVAQSEDLGAGGIVIEGGIASALRYDFGRFSVTLGNQVTEFFGASYEADGITYDPNVDQQILKNGLRLEIPVGRWVFGLQGIHTALFQSAPVDQYATVGGSVGYHCVFAQTTDGFLRAGLYADLGDDYSAVHGSVSAGWRW